MILLFVPAHLLCGLAMWALTFPSYLYKLVSVRNRLFKLVAGGEYRNRMTPFYSQFNALKPLDLVKHEIAKIVHRHLHSHFHLLYYRSSL